MNLGKYTVSVLLLGFVSSVAFATGAHSAFDSITEKSVDSADQSLNIKYGDQVLDHSAVSAADPALSLLNLVHGGNTGHLFVGRASYSLPYGSAKLTAALFEDFKTTQYLLGSDYALTFVSQTPFMFRGKREVSVLFFSADLISETELEVYEKSAVPAPLQPMVNQLSAGHNGLVRVIFQKITGSVKYISNTFFLTLIYQGTNLNATQIENYTVSSLIDSDFDDIPDFIRDSTISSIANTDLVGYAQRLSKLK